MGNTNFLGPLNPPILVDFEFSTPQNWGAGRLPGTIILGNHPI